MVKAASGRVTGDARGFSIAHYSDAEHFDMLANLAKHRWGLRGVGHQHDPHLVGVD